MTNLKLILDKLIKDEQELKKELEVIQEQKEAVASQLLDSYKSDSYTSATYTVYKKPFYKIEVANEALAKEYMIPQLVLDKKALIADWKKKKEIKGFRIDEEIKVLVRNKTTVQK